LQVTASPALVLSKVIILTVPVWIFCGLIGGYYRVSG